MPSLIDDNIISLLVSLRGSRFSFFFIPVEVFRVGKKLRWGRRGWRVRFYDESYNPRRRRFYRYYCFIIIIIITVIIVIIIITIRVSLRVYRIYAGPLFMFR